MVNKPKTSKLLMSPQIGVFCLLFGLLMIVAFRTIRQNNTENKNAIASEFASCVTAGNPISESYPRVCITKDGQSSTEPLEPVSGEYAQIETRRGKVVQFDGHLVGDGVKGQLVIESSPGVTHGYYVGNGGSVSCDRSLVKLVQTNEIKSGDLVEVRSQLAGLKAESGQATDDIGFQIVCGEGTFIKKLDPNAL
jgi:hypothetical protein